MQVEYRVIETPYGPGRATYQARALQSGLNELGKEGWELVTCIGTLLIFKRIVGVEFTTASVAELGEN